MMKYVSLWTILKWFSFLLLFCLIFFYSLCWWCHLSVTWKTVAATRSSSSHRYTWANMLFSLMETLSTSDTRVECQNYYLFPQRSLLQSENELVSSRCLAHPQSLPSAFRWQQQQNSMSPFNKALENGGICIRISYSLKYLFIRQTCFPAHLPISVIAVSGFFSPY